MLESFFNENAGQPATLFKRDTNTGVSCEYSEIFKNTYFEEHLQTVASIITICTMQSQVLVFKRRER